MTPQQKLQVDILMQHIQDAQRWLDKAMALILETEDWPVKPVFTPRHDLKYSDSPSKKRKPAIHA